MYVSSFDLDGRRALSVESSLETSFLLEKIDANENFDPRVLARQARDLQRRYFALLGPRGMSAQYRDLLTYRKVAETMFAAALQTPDFKDVAQKVYRTMTDGIGVDIARYDPNPKARALYDTVNEANILEAV